MAPRSRDSDADLATSGIDDGPSQRPDTIAQPSQPVADSPARQVQDSTLSESKTSKATESISTAPTSLPSNAQRPSLVAPGTASARFRDSVRKVIYMKRTSTVLSMLGAGAEPGIDPRRSSAYMNYGHIKQECVIDVADYSSLRSEFMRMDNKEFIEYLNNASAHQRAPWVRVRWINIGGISWDVISTLALTYGMHPLAIEDVLHQRVQSISKSDYYPKHLFIRILQHCLPPEGEDNSPMDAFSPTFTDLPRSSSPVGMREEDDKDEWKQPVNGSTSGSKSKFSTHKNRVLLDMEKGRYQPPNLPKSARWGHEEVANTMAIEEFKKDPGRIAVRTKPMYFFLFRDGTVVSIQPAPDVAFTQPIMNRLRQKDTGLRATADASLLLQSLIDLLVDQALELVDEYQKQILKIEHQVLIKTSMKAVRRLHILSGDLALHKRSLEPIKTLVYGLRRYDVDRCAALINSSMSDSQKASVEGFMSQKSKIYLADVLDHIDYILSSLDMFSSITENLINYTFNMASYEMNEVMRRLTLATIIFLPLTLLTGYFGMNFDNMWSIMHGHSDIWFWIIALPVMSIVLPTFLWSDIEKLVHYCQKRWTARKFAEHFKKRQ